MGVAWKMLVCGEGLIPSYMSEAINDPVTPIKIANTLDIASAITGFAFK
jgi:hypothetical protein